MTAILEASNIVKKFGDLTAVAGISFQIAAGECVAFLGPNGAGKTTTIEILEGLQDATSGNLTIFGKTYSQDRRGILDQLGVVLQETKLYKKYTIKETLELFASFYQDPLPIGTLITQLQLQEKTHVRLEKLSGGQKQRVYLGCALINQPKLLFLDEPTTGLDPQARRAIWDILRQYKGQQRSILLTTHYMDEAEQLADRVLVIDHGKIIATGSPQELIRTYCGNDVLCMQFRGLSPDAAKTKLNGSLPWLQNATSVGETLEVRVEKPVQALETVLAVAQREQLTLEKLEIRRASLEDVFLTLTGRSIRDA